MKLYDVTTRMAVNGRSIHTLIRAENECAAKYSAKKMHRAADGQYPKVTKIELVTES